jgi:hypothetical protein
MPYRKIDEGSAEDTSGNMPLRKVSDGSGDETADAEGNGVRVRFVKDGADDDTEGNGLSARG